ncbi:MAG: triose-phosphate isomerase, partial [Endozoicomonadaceae bacterium]|nr:triose-phosphate isomerase [Endozoicomonadaceae bacterium]
MRKPLLAANWKMNGSLTENEKRLTLFKEKLSNLEHQDIVIFPPAIYIPQTANLLYNSDISWGFQNIFHESMGAYTGEHSPGMAKDYGV